MTAFCKHCNVELIPLTNWRAGNIKQNLKWCANCISQKRAKHYQANKETIKCKLKTYRLKSKEQVMLSRTKTKCKLFNIDFNLDISDIHIPDKCPVFNKPFTYGKGQSKYSPSLDRIDPTKGYVKNNVQVISFLANTMKNNATEEELHAFANWIKS